MASGCVISDCWICGEPVYEDEWDLMGKHVVHEECKERFYKSNNIVDKFSYIDSIKTHIEMYKDMIKLHESHIETLRKLINEMEDEINK